MFLQDHRENGQLQPDHPGDSPSLGPPGSGKSLHSQLALPLQLHQCGRHPAGEERPTAANPATGLPWNTDHHNPLHKLVCVTQRFIYTALKNIFKYTSIYLHIAYKQTIAINTGNKLVYICSVFCQGLSLSLIQTPVLCCFVCTTGIWRVSCVRPATPSSSTALRCTALSTKLLTMNQVSEQRSTQIYQVRLRT